VDLIPLSGAIYFLFDCVAFSINVKRQENNRKYNRKDDNIQLYSKIIIKIITFQKLQNKAM
jgi:hypothetical protein